MHAQTLALPPGALHAQIPRVCNDPHVETLQRPSGAQRPPLTIYLATTRDTDERATNVLIYIWTIVAHSQTNVMLADQDIHGAYTHLMWRGVSEYPQSFGNHADTLNKCSKRVRPSTESVTALGNLLVI